MDDLDAILHFDYELSAREVRALISAATIAEGFFEALLEDDPAMRLMCEAHRTAKLPPAVSAALKLSTALAIEQIDVR